MTQEQLFQMKMNLTRKQLEVFVSNELFTWQWWLLLAATIIPWVIWISIRNREQQGRLIYGGMFIAIVALVCDMYGTTNSLPSPTISLRFGCVTR